MKAKEGKCPKCGADLIYGNTEIQDRSLVYEVECPDCDFTGTEWYKLVYSSTFDSNGKPQ